jgi:hypothetical protein
MDKSFKGANGITQATPNYTQLLFITFMTTFGEIFLEYSSKNLQKIFLKKIILFY